MEPPERRLEKLARDLQRKGCHSQIKIFHALQVFGDLKECGYGDLRACYETSVDTIYIMGRKSKSDDACEIFVPLSMTSFINIGWLKKIYQVLCEKHLTKRVVIAFNDANTGVLYNTLDEGFVPPDPVKPKEDTTVGKSNAKKKKKKKTT